MRTTPWLLAEPYRLKFPRNHRCYSAYGESCGAFDISGPCGMPLRVIVSAALPEHGVHWEHVSVSCRNRCPNWQEMNFIKDIFWAEDETVVQFHPPKSEYVNCHPYCLHLWRPVHFNIELPPSIMVGPDEYKVGNNEHK